jgi:hypothetical protein
MERTCIKADQLRKNGYSNLEEWVNDPKHIYIGRRNHWVNGANDSPWKNPFSVK